MLLQHAGKGVGVVDAGRGDLDALVIAPACLVTAERADVDDPGMAHVEDRVGDVAARAVLHAGQPVAQALSAVGVHVVDRQLRLAKGGAGCALKAGAVVVRLALAHAHPSRRAS
ncbi:hypothetical protein D3C78_1745330 [compost metagenome]